ncbi:sulfurtransferase [Paenibacillus pinisoli]|uniref:Sulfurtransferase n=1 Tax=Paenibacillus pinisoli TaxID=1276110 RepID=A0A3A6PP43_9BACL|nr:sulfurtransferase [Paenibacillus pinisoli]RJX39969.1 sulfurtransferase [Paenibacillus pinisoli]
MSSNVVNVEQLKARLDSGERIVLLDVRFHPKESSYGREAYSKGHLPGARFIDFKADLTRPEQEHGGRSPLPSPEELASLFGSLGIDRDTAVVAYEDGNGPAAARLWWVLRYLGAERVQVLDGGYSAWSAAGGEAATEVTVDAKPRQFVPAVQAGWLVGVDEVRAVSAGSGQSSAKLVDSRDAAQYAGLEAPFDPVAGHIPGALHYFWKDALLDDGSWKSPEQLRERFASLPKDEEIIVYCGSGISATPNVLALREAGYENVKLYAGSWSDWISYCENPVAVGDKEKA